MASASGEEGAIGVEGRQVVDSRLVARNLEAEVLAVTNDNCPAVANPGQADGDADGVGDPCDNCRKVANAGISPGHVGTGGQTDDDQDGIGNVCDADFDQSGFVNVTDLLRLLDAFGEAVDGNTCPDEAGIPSGSCAPYDLTVEGSVINVSDLLVVISSDLFGTSVESHGCAPAEDGAVHCPLP